MPPQIPYAKECSQLSSRAVDENGFIAMHRLAEQIGARIEVRPLLVEAAIATDTEAKDHNAPWVVLIDSERFEVSHLQIEEESCQRPLESRLRTTIAHELLHTLMFTADGENPKLYRPRKKGEKTTDYIKKVEALTEKLTPLLLITESEIDNFAAKPNTSLYDFLLSREKWGVSREILISRFCLLDAHDFRRHHGGGIKNTALGIVQRNSSREWEMQPWPLFHNFHLDRHPWFISELVKGRPVSLSKVMPDLSILNKATEREIDMPGHRSDERFDYMRMQVRVVFESVEHSREYPFLFFVQKVSG